ncbi:epimerase [Saccharothrix sp. ALI-22-I]|uniref:NAD-dependent epimerase/dehydratase family protein n=1 Tax=Saccharothrix sp. ALI-22-I TaxID=1933778 RepID=UPI00097BEB89|nr:NAD-dependent epimerase/dehydratase family protein [Saccharothrix sp. ALI-22-I]ONI89775.1 epimerase [Saccharothrix sp. ALI-22-I]
MSASRVVVTGGGGFIGSHLVERLIARGDEVTVFDGTSSPPHQKIALQHARYIQGDVLDAAALRRAITKGVDMVFHLAAVVGVDQYLARPLEVIDVNVTGTRNVLDLASEVGAKVVVTSTSEVFGKNPSVPWREDDDRVLGSTAADRWAYSSSKALAEHITFGFVRQRRLQATIVRYFNVYGGGQRPGFLVSRSVHRALNGRPLIVYDTGKQTRSFTFVQDAISATLLAADHPAAVGEAFNVGSMTETTIGDTVRLIAELAGPQQVPITYVDTQATLGQSYEDLSRRIPDNSKARALLGWRPTTTLKDGLAQTIAWARDNPWWLALPDSGA